MADKNRPASAAGLAQQRARQAIYDKRKQILEQEHKKAPPTVPDGAPEVLRELYAAAQEVWQQLLAARDQTGGNDWNDEWSDGWNKYVEQIGAVIRKDKNHLTDPLVQKYLDGRRTLADKKALDRYKNYVGRLSSQGVSSVCSEVDLWIAFFAARMWKQGVSVSQLRRDLLRRLPKDPLDERMPTDVERLADKLLSQKLADHPDLADDPEQRLLAEMAAIGWIWQVEIRRRLGTTENLRQKLRAMGIEVIHDDDPPK